MRRIDILKYLPPIVADSREFKLVANGVNPELILNWEALEEVMDNQFIMTLSIVGIERWEAMLQLYPKPSDSLDQRRLRILVYTNSKIPYTMRFLIGSLTTMFNGADNFTVNYNNEGYVLKISIHILLGDLIFEFIDFMNRIVPCNVITKIEFQHKIDHEIYFGNAVVSGKKQIVKSKLNYNLKSVTGNIVSGILSRTNQKTVILSNNILFVKSLTYPMNCFLVNSDFKKTSVHIASKLIFDNIGFDFKVGSLSMMSNKITIKAV